MHTYTHVYLWILSHDVVSPWIIIKTALMGHLKVHTLMFLASKNLFHFPQQPDFLLRLC